MVKLKLNFRYCVALYCITMLYASLHELVHHFVARMVCGAWGYKTFNSFETACADGDHTSLIATAAGPIFSFLMMYVGWYFLQQGQTSFKKHLGFALIFAQLPAQRMSGPLMGFNDEYYIVRLLDEASLTNQWLTALAISAICIPPLVAAFKAIKNRYRWAWFALFFLLLPYLLFGPFFVLLEYLMVGQGILDEAILGIGTLFLINEILTILLYYRTKKYIDPEA